MVFEFDYVPLAIASIGLYAPGAEIEVESLESQELAGSENPWTGGSNAPAVRQKFPMRLDLDSAIPIWNADPKTIQNEITSPLLRLPAELKLKIWAMAYEDVAVHISFKEDISFGHFICSEDRSAFHRTGSAISGPEPSHLEYVQCPCRGSMLEPPYQDSPSPLVVKHRRERMPEERDVPKIGGMLLACREIYANARDYLWTQPNFILPTQRLLPRFAVTIHAPLFHQITKITLHTWFDSWRIMTPSGFFGGCSDHSGPEEWDQACAVLGNCMPSLSYLHLIVHASGGDSTIWYPQCKPAACVATLDRALWKNRLPAMLEPVKDDAPVAELLETVDRNTDEFVDAAKQLLGSKIPGLRCVVTAAVESSRHRPGIAGSWVTMGQMRGNGARRMVLRERNMEMLSELELNLPAGWELAWWVSLEEREKGAVGAGPAPWPFNHLPA